MYNLYMSLLVKGLVWGRKIYLLLLVKVNKNGKILHGFTCFTFYMVLHGLIYDG